MPGQHTEKTVTAPNGIVWRFSRYLRGSKWCLLRRWNVVRCPNCRGIRYVNGQTVIRTMYKTPEGWVVRSRPIKVKPGVEVQAKPKPRITCACPGKRGPRRLQAGKSYGQPGHRPVQTRMPHKIPLG